MIEWLGKTIGKVRIDKYLARGAMGEVYLGTHLTLERPVAIKVLHSYIEENPDLLERFHREAKVVAGLRHPNIVQIYDFDTIDGHPYIVMEYLKGPPLATYLRELHNRNDRIPHHQVARLLKGLTESLDYAHEQNVIHRDIKPANILLHGKAEEISLDQPLTNDVEAILTDFGLVRIANAASQTATGVITGTPAYMSPEQARGDQTDHRSDIYSLGIVLYEMLAGRVPFEGDSTLSVIYKQINDPPPPIPALPREVQKVIDRALVKYPEDRYPTARNMAVDFFLAIGMTEDAKTIINIMHEDAKSTYHEETDASPKRISATVKSKSAGRKPARIGLGILSFVGLLAIAFGAFFKFYTPSLLPNPTGVQVTQSLAPTVSSTPEVQMTQTVAPAATPAPPVVSGLPDTVGMVAIPGGTYEVGTKLADTYHSDTMNVTLGGYWIDQYPITYAKFQQFLVSTGSQAPGVLGIGNQPVRGVTWEQAVAYCTWVNKRLPDEAEWEAAGRGPGSNPQIYPWGNDPKADGNDRSLPDQDTYEVGTLAFNVSPFGVYDMVGNIWEWVGQPYARTPDGLKILRGGRFGLPVLELTYRLPVAPDDARYVKYAGFRCAASQGK